MTRLPIKVALPDEEDDIDLTPMIDCVFLLVLFFMVTSSFIDEAKAFEVRLPTADTATTIPRDAADSISIGVDGKLALRLAAGEQEIEGPEALLEALRNRAEKDRSRPVIIRCDARCEYQQFVRVKNVLKLAGVQTIFEEVEVRRERK